MILSSRLLAHASFLVVALLLGTEVAFAKCDKDTDCKGDRICEAGVCVSPHPAVVEQPSSSLPSASVPAPADSAAAPPDSSAAPTSTVVETPPTSPGTINPAPTNTESTVSHPTPPTPPPSRPSPVTNSTTTSGPKRLLLVGGIVTLSVGYLIALVSGGVATAVASSQNGTYGASCITGAPLNFIPFVGPWVFAAGYPNHQVVGYGQGRPEVLDCNGSRSFAMTLVAVDEVLQLSGAGMITAGMLMHRETIDRKAIGKLELVPGTPSTPLGMSLVIRNF